MCGLIQPVFRLPYVPLNKAQRQKGVKLLQKFMADIPGVQDIRAMEDDEFKLIERY